MEPLSDRNGGTDASTLAEKILRQVRADFGSAWASRLSKTDRELVEAVTADAATVVLLGLTASPERAAREKAHVDAQLLNVTSVEAARVSREFWASMAAAVKTALGFALVLA